MFPIENKKASDVTMITYNWAFIYSSFSVKALLFLSSHLVKNVEYCLLSLKLNMTQIMSKYY